MTVKQKTLQIPFVIHVSFVLCAALCGSCIAVAVSGSAVAQMLPATGGANAADLRLIATPGLNAGGYEVGVEITMASGSHTYWKMPGEAGVPPIFAFNGSENVAAATVLFPVPRRITEEGLDAFGYTDGVVFPVQVIPKDPAKPSVLHADVTYAVCNKICMPAHGEAIMTLVPKAQGNAETAGQVAAAFAQVPRAASPLQQGALMVTRSSQGTGEGAKPTWTLTWRGSIPLEDIFAEAPEGCFFSTKAIGGSTWSLVADQTVGTNAVPVSLTLKQKTGGFVVMETLDVAAPIR